MILFSNNKTCTYETKQPIDCCDAETKRVNEGWN
jgi:hypothetical protein